MTEIGMALSNPLWPASARIPGFVGRPLPSVQVKVVDPVTRQRVQEGEQGELLVKVKVHKADTRTRPTFPSLVSSSHLMVSLYTIMLACFSLNTSLSSEAQPPQYALLPPC